MKFSFSFVAVSTLYLSLSFFFFFFLNVFRDVGEAVYDFCDNIFSIVGVG